MDSITTKFKVLKSLAKQFQDCVDDLEILVNQQSTAATKRTVTSLEIEVKDNLERSNRSFSWPNLAVEEDVSMLYLPFASVEKRLGDAAPIINKGPSGRRRASTEVDKHHELFEQIITPERKRAQSISPVGSNSGSSHPSPETSTKHPSASFSPTGHHHCQNIASSRLEPLSVCSSGKSTAFPDPFSKPLLATTLDLSSATTAQKTTLASDDVSTLSPLTEDWFSEASLSRPVVPQPHFQVQLLDVIWTFTLLRCKRGTTFYYIDCLSQTKRTVLPREQIVLPNIPDSAKMIAVDGGGEERSMTLSAKSFVPLSGGDGGGGGSKTALTFSLTEDNLVAVHDASKLREGANKHSRMWSNFKSV